MLVKTVVYSSKCVMINIRFSCGLKFFFLNAVIHMSIGYLTRRGPFLYTIILYYSPQLLWYFTVHARA